jgi:hypothetical protein
MKKVNVFDFVEDTITKTNEIKGIDFEVVSYVVLTEYMDMKTADDYFGINTKELLKEYTAEGIEKILKSHPKAKGVFEISPTPFPYGANDNVVFYKMKDDVDINLAINVGLGVVRMLSGEYKGELLLYNASNFSKEDFQTRDEFIMLKMYIQLRYPNEYDDRKLERFINDYEEYVYMLVPTNANAIIRRFKEIFASKKGGNNLVSFKTGV